MPRKRKDLMDGAHGRGREKPVQRNAANARERARMRILSRAFSRLKTTLPWVPADTKLSKLDTLRLATSYIAHLRSLLCDDQPSKSNQLSPHPIALSWPFTFNKSHQSRESHNEPNLPSNCDSFNHFNQHHEFPYNHNSAGHQINHTVNHIQSHNQIDRYYGDETQDYEYYPSELFQIS